MAKRTLFWVVQGVFLGLCGATGFHLLIVEETAIAPWGVDGLGFLGALTAVISLSKRLPLQNVLFAAFIAGIASLLLLLARSGLFPPSQFLSGPCFWIVFIFTTRGVTRLALKPFRDRHFYGFWVIGCAAVLTASQAASLDHFTNLTTSLSLRETGGLGSPPLLFLFRGFTALLTLVIVSPILIDKNPKPQAERIPILIPWLALNIVFLAGSLRAESWPLTAFSLVHMAVIPAVACLGNRRARESVVRSD
ncbi:MAG TPA: hypothetical protein VN673_12425 [Clostridia bacterium]|nr:hypothetical protein [Clostridia bacterium]